MTKMKLTAIAVTTWVSGFVATAALAYSVHRPLEIVSPVAEHVAPSSPLADLASLDIPAPEPEQLIVLPTVEIIGTIAPAVHVIPAPYTMHCSDWRPLLQGGSSVQICD